MLFSVYPARMTRFVLLAVILVTQGILTGCGSNPQTSSRSYDRFFQSVQAEDEQAVLKLMHGDLQAKIDAAFLKQWVLAFHESYGDYEGMSWTNFKTNASIENGVRTTDTSGTFDLQRGSVNGEFRLINGEITSFTVDADKLDYAQIVSQVDVATYRPLTDRFVNQFFAMKLTDMRDEIRLGSDAEFEKASQVASQVIEKNGEFKSATHLNSQWLNQADSAEMYLSAVYRCEMANSIRNLEVGLAFDGMKAYATKLKFVSMIEHSDTIANQVDEADQPLIERSELLLNAIVSGDAGEIEEVLRDNHRSLAQAPCVVALAKTMRTDGGDLQLVEPLSRTIVFRRSDQFDGVRASLKSDDTTYDLSLLYDRESAELIEISAPQLSSTAWGPQLDTDAFKAQAELFLQKLMEREAEAAYEMMDPALQQVITKQALLAGSEGQFKRLGPIKSIKFSHSATDADEGGNFELMLFFKLEHEEDTVIGRVGYVFTELRGRLIAFSSDVQE